ncbi:hypothetical protein EDB19DRAFT_1832821 [Suillus lakei]|nr:hypothetical protein EDB19DRAFT_1832821 [Suillus lakei]
MLLMLLLLLDLPHLFLLQLPLQQLVQMMFFFRENSVTGKHICVPCEDYNKADPSCPIAVYGSSMSNSPLHSHIYKVHIELYLQESKKQQWPIGIHPVGTCLNEGWTFAKIRERLKDPTCTTKTLGPPPSHSNGRLLEHQKFQSVTCQASPSRRCIDTL